MVEAFLQKTPFFRVVFPFATGIALSPLFIGSRVLFLVILLFVLLIVTLVTARNSGFRLNYISGLLFSFLFFIAGVTQYRIASQKPVFPEADSYLITLLETPVEKEKSYRAEALVVTAGNRDTLAESTEHLLVYFGKSDSVSLLKAGDRILFHGQPSWILNDGNPYSFDYESYMNRRGIFRQIYIQDGSWNKAGEDTRIIPRIFAERARERIIGLYIRNNLAGDTLTILSALTPGYKKSLDPEIRQVFANSGAMHVLAVSGLHVGIIFLAFNVVFGFLKRKQSGRIFFVVLVIVSLWVYAFLTGLSPSVQRAALMFSLVQAGDVLRRPVNIYNTLAASAFILLAVNPQLLFEVGFQLSYSAVFGIVYFQPLLGRLLGFRNRLAKYIWDLLTVSFAAQIGTFAISCFYFRQFPVWFWLTNLVVIPAALVFIILAIAIVFFSVLPVVSSFLASITGKLTGLMFEFLKMIDSFPGAVISGFNFSVLSLILLLSLVLLTVMFIETRRKLFLFTALGATVVLIANSSVLNYLQIHRREIIVYNSRQPIVHFISGKTNYVVTQMLTDTDDMPVREISNTVAGMRLSEPDYIDIGHNYETDDLLKSGNLVFFRDMVLILPGSSVEQANLVKPDIILDYYGYRTLKSQDMGQAVIVSNRIRNRTDSVTAGIHALRYAGAFRKRLQ
jgi:competence protein ComEC